MGTEVGLWEGLVTSIADTLYELAGVLLVRTTAPYSAGSASISVESTERFASSGKIAIGGQVANYASHTATAFTGLTDKDGNVGVQVDLPTGAVIVDLSRSQTQLDELRASFILATAQDEDLDTLARNYGLTRPRGVGRETFRSVLREITFGFAQTMYLCEQVLDALFGPGNYELYEDAESYPHTVFVNLTHTLSTSPAGRTYLVGGERKVTATPNVTVDYNPVIVYGIYNVSDPTRRGTNYALLPIAVTTGPPIANRRMITSAGLFLPSDDGKWVLYGGIETWRAEYVSANKLALSRGRYPDGKAASAGIVFRSEYGLFSPWMVGHYLDIYGGPNSGSGIFGSRPITAYLSRYEVEVGGTSLVADASMEWGLHPYFPTGASIAEINRTTVVGKTITAPVALPAQVYVDYTTVPSAEIMPTEDISGTGKSPFYISDDGALAQALLDLITAAGIRVVTTIVG